ncbi:hypothetical protein [Bosea sp. PAMC 26642]|uniref:hypothetical protein n=1 Tax=Bosea sp. (strain PAMC 26642) TaxID=1792307 RepID=UPI00076FFA9A|nr:hypothetical protein [Bosea sp. PAMC 26642]AMJ59435.1 hypothetical protein AXW83_03165 [Bosea sp. PAMC 26642]
MTQLSNSSTTGKVRFLRSAAFAVLATGALCWMAPTPAAALETDWKQGCIMKSSPQGYGEMIRERQCGHLNDCQRMADAKGAMMTGMGCFFVAPSSGAAATDAGQARATKR